MAFTKNKISKSKVTPLGTFLKPLNAKYGQITYGWGTAPIMLVFMFLFALFLTVILSVYNNSIVL
uniref:Photosystem II 10 kDa protein n=1 Tax=Colacium vesiculosum TaxID=102910 RepID=I6NI07_9EUGL|nr:photosystem II 10 kDa protein [Colacium vesiculosum]